jgi:acylphosphatase
MIKHYNITISGRVQGVGFRYTVRNVAKNMGVKGYAKNMHNGNVYIEAEADENTISEFLKWCQKGPDHAYVVKVDIEQGGIIFFDNFEIRY